MNTYIGHKSQLYGVEEHRLVGGKGDGMRLFQVTNGKGLAFTVSADRCADIVTKFIIHRATEYLRSLPIRGWTALVIRGGLGITNCPKMRSWTITRII